MGPAIVRNIYCLNFRMRDNVKADILQRRRVRAARLFERGWRVTDIANALQVSPAAVSQWIRAYRVNGIDGLQSTPKTGAPTRLTHRHQMLLRALVQDSPRDHGLSAEHWDRPLLQQMIKKLFGVSYSLQHIGRLLKRLLADKQPLPSVTRLELTDLLKKSDIARIRSRIIETHGKRRQ